MRLMGSLYCLPLVFLWITEWRSEIIQLLNDAYPESVDSIPADVATTLRQFKEHGCVEVE